MSGIAKPVLKALQTGLQEASNGAEEPMFGTLDGVPVVTITAARYRELLEGFLKGKDRPLLTRAPARRPRAPLPSTIERDPEVASFLREQFKLAATLEQLRAACLERFGPERTPSVSRIGGLRMRARDGW